MSSEKNKPSDNLSEEELLRIKDLYISVITSCFEQDYKELHNFNGEFKKSEKSNAEGVSFYMEPELNMAFNMYRCGIALGVEISSFTRQENENTKD